MMVYAMTSNNEKRFVHSIYTTSQLAREAVKQWELKHCDTGNTTLEAGNWCCWKVFVHDVRTEVMSNE